MPTLDQWTEADLQALCDAGTEESANLEFKAGRALQNTDGQKFELAKDVSAMANAAGGLIIYGIAEQGGKAHHLEGVTEPGVTTDWIGQVIDGGIEPRVAGVSIRRLPLTGGSSAFLVEVPQATAFAPHQATKRTQYFRRHGTKVLPMLDHEVRDLMRRAAAPRLELTLSFEQSRAEVFYCNVEIINHSPEPALYTALELAFDEELEAVAPAPPFSREHAMLHGPRAQPRQATLYRRNLIVPSDMPLFRERPHRVLRSLMTIRENSWFAIWYRIQTPGFSTEATGIITRTNLAAPQIEYYAPMV